MYEEHFGLRPRPFGAGVGPVGPVPLASHDAARRRLRYGLEHGEGPALLFGPPGVGKTTLALAVADDMGGPSVHLTFPAMPALDLLTLLADELGLPPARGGGGGIGGEVARLRLGLSQAARRGERPLVIVDEAHLIDDPATFEAIRLVLNFATLGPPDVMLLLVGGPEVLLRLPPALADRLTARCSLGPLSPAETAAYVAGRVEAAGGQTPLFDEESLVRLHRAAEGLPRRLNRLADLSLLIAYAEGKPQVGSPAVEAAAREVFDPSLAA